MPRIGFRSLTRVLTRASLLLALVPACGDDTSADGNADDIGPDGGVTITSDGSGTAESGDSSGSSGSTDNGTGSSEDNGTGSSDSNTTSSGDSADGGPKFDLGKLGDAGVGNCEGMGGGGDEWSYIWVANSSEGTISKVNTVTLVEEGRYRTRADNLGSPSRTSVNLTGDVAVANRESSVTKVIAVHENCDEMHNGQPGLQTSSGKNDVLAWGQDDCVAWNTPFDGFNTQRPIAWTSGVLNPNTCAVEDQFVWTAAAQHNVAGSTHVFRINGDDGTVDEDIPIPQIGGGYFGPYGGAVNSENDFWFVTYDTSQLVRVDFETLVYDIYPVQAGCPYGFTVDSLDRPWIGEFCSGSAVFDPDTQQWTSIPGVLGYGLQEDDNEVMWIGTFSPPGLRGVNIQTLQEVKWIMLPTQSSRGVSVDFQGYVWFVDMQTSAWRVDTDAETWQAYSGLNGPYTYSDMTGHGLQIVSGGIPQG